MRLVPSLTAIAALALAAPAAAAVVTVSSGPGSGSATQSCDGPGGPFSGATTISLTRTCSRADVGEATGSARASVGHLGAGAVATSHNGNSLIAGTGAEGIYSDLVTFTSTNPAATSAEVSLNLLLDGVLETAGFPNAAAIEGSAAFGGVFDFFRFNLSGGSFSVDQNSFSTVGVLGPMTDAVLTSRIVHVALNTPITVEIRLQAGAVASGPGGFGRSDFGGSFKFPSSGVFNLADGVTANAGDYLVDNRFIDPLAPPTGGVPESAAWTLMIAGFGLAGATLRRRHVLV